MHLAKHMQFHGVDYIVVPLELWEEAKNTVQTASSNFDTSTHRYYEELYEQMCAYDNSNEPTEIPNE